MRYDMRQKKKKNQKDYRRGKGSQMSEKAVQRAHSRVANVAQEAQALANEPVKTKAKKRNKAREKTKKKLKVP